MAFGEMDFTHKRVTRVGDGAGGKTETTATVSASGVNGIVTGRKHFYQRISQFQLEKTEQAARAVRAEQFVAFDDPDLDIRQHDLLYEGEVADGDEAGAVGWIVRHVRQYDFQTQADVERVA